MNKLLIWTSISLLLTGCWNDSNSEWYSDEIMLLKEEIWSNVCSLSNAGRILDGFSVSLDEDENFILEIPPICYWWKKCKTQVRTSNDISKVDGINIVTEYDFYRINWRHISCDKKKED